MVYYRVRDSYRKLVWIYVKGLATTVYGEIHDKTESGPVHVTSKELMLCCTQKGKTQCNILSKTVTVELRIFLFFCERTDVT